VLSLVGRVAAVRRLFNSLPSSLRTVLFSTNHNNNIDTKKEQLIDKSIKTVSDNDNHCGML